MDGIEQGDGVGGLVGLKLADEVQGDVRRLFAEGRPFGLRFLNPVLAKDALPGGDQRLDGGGVLRLGNSDEGDVIGGAASEASGAAHGFTHGVQAVRGFDAVGRHGRCYRRGR